ncbi:MAG: glycine betaine/L-proline ABC transporter ATP-binding protein [Syntrophomonadaceae bacterium]|nr:glycine betaine/L-proline ABC transporter ATP-binding protein [Syntrophomonadaceae bacterium]MDD3888441.1 glycine betaine/L-proline ABC transporter ATP-binding protein [Syntrophomonadaceae bacterium]MDD4549193.1 glycine betaine/L-proline ABC transporter ATP-binding protein [Syntrophomonadaceae bacterium]
MAKIEVKNLIKIYGTNTDKALEMVRQGADNIEIRKKTKQVVGVRNASFSVEQGESFVIMGLSGSGKSTLIRCINRLIKPSAGEILIDGEDISKMPSKQLEDIRRRKMAMVFQRFALLPHRTIVDNVAYGLEIQGISRDKRYEQAMRTIELVGLKGWEESYPSNLSGGMQQRVGIARALATDPDILLMDEPFSALDPLIRQEMQDELLEIQQKLQKTIIFITHDLDEALKVGDRIALMKDAQIVQMGQPEDILLSPATEYVARFVENVNRSKALTASAVMVKPRSVVHPKDGPLTALYQMEKYGISSLFVTDRSGHLTGYIRAEDASDIAEQGIKQLDSIIQTDIPVTHPDEYLSNLLEVMAHTKVPVAVVDENNILKGILVRGSVIAGLAGERREFHE